MMGCTCIPSTWEVETGGSEFQYRIQVYVVCVCACVGACVHVVSMRPIWDIYHLSQLNSSDSCF